MPLYRIIRNSGRSAVPSSTWLSKPTDEEALTAARDLLGRGDYAEVWGERELVGCLRAPTAASDPRAAQRAGRGRPMMRYVAAGLATTTGIALVFMTLQGAGRPPNGSAALDGGAPNQQAAVVTPAAADEATAPGTSSAAMDLAAASGGAEPSIASQPGSAPGEATAETATLDPQSLEAAAAPFADPPSPAPDTPNASRPAQRAPRHAASRQYAARTTERERVFASSGRSEVNVYAMFGQGFVQGGN